MRILTVQQPWAYAIFHGKDVENRTWMSHHSGRIAIHAGKRLDEAGCMIVPDLLADEHLAEYADQPLVMGAVLGTADLVDVHWDTGDCCDSPWAESSYAEADGDGARRIRVSHFVLKDQHLFAEPIPARGALSLRVIKDPVLIEQIAQAA